MEMAYCHDRGIPHSVFLEWDPEDRAKALAFSIESSLRCAMCGTAKWEWDENRFAYTVIEELCQGCYQKSAVQDRDTKSLPGTNVKLVPTTSQLRAQMAITARKRERMRRRDEE